MIDGFFSLLTRHHTSAAFATAGSLFASIGMSGIPGWIAVITAAGAFFGLAALKSTAALWRGERNAERVKADRLEMELNTEKSAHLKTLHRLEVAEAKPDVEKLYDLMRAHDDLMRAHDERTADVSKQIADALAASSRETAAALQEVAASLAANTGALTLWATEQAQKI